MQNVICSKREGKSATKRETRDARCTRQQHQRYTHLQLQMVTAKSLDCCRVVDWRSWWVWWGKPQQQQQQQQVKAKWLFLCVFKWSLETKPKWVLFLPGMWKKSLIQTKNKNCEKFFKGGGKFFFLKINQEYTPGGYHRGSWLVS